VSVFIAHIDGGARGNPGPAGWGALIHSDGGDVVAELNGAIGTATNNVAEYHGLVAALQWCLAHGATRVTIKSDSLLLVQQMRGAYKIKSEGLKPLYGQARLVATRIGRVTYEHVPRERNKDADRLANEAMDSAEHRIEE
jgi:ribonuclease HI